MSRLAYFLSFVFLVSSLQGLAGCASEAKKTQLENTIKAYSRALRDADGSGLLAFVHPEQQKDFAKNSRGLKGLMFSDVEIKKIYPDEKMESALVTLSMEYYSQDGSQVFSAMRQYSWAYDQKLKAWFTKEATPFGSN